MSFIPIKKEIREQIMHRIKVDGVPAAQAAREHGVSKSTVYSWIERDTASQVSIAEYSRLKRQNQGLYELVGKLTHELDKQKRGKLPR
ncbi:MAG: hypothetical protein BWY19_01190 [bacterium ADurb.Bin212]|jgi:transposase-like protein|nr:MAG: hypothetical protein BWY19_01190 [bacterium ADurb.Bin212]